MGQSNDIGLMTYKTEAKLPKQCCLSSRQKKSLQQQLKVSSMSVEQLLEVNDCDQKRQRSILQAIQGTYGLTMKVSSCCLLSLRAVASGRDMLLYLTQASVQYFDIQANIPRLTQQPW